MKENKVTQHPSAKYEKVAEPNFQQSVKMKLYGGAFDGQVIQVNYQNPAKQILPEAIQLPIESKLALPAHLRKAKVETYILKDVGFSKKMFWKVYIQKDIGMEQFVEMLLTGYKSVDGRV